MSVLHFTGNRIGWCACALTALIAGSAAAADLSPAVSYPASYKDAPVVAPSWTGFYAGVNGGYGWDAKSSAHTYDDASYYIFSNYDFPTTSNGIDRSGGFGGGQIGYNWQFPGGFKDGPNPWFLGVEADIQGAGISGHSSANGELITSPGIPTVAPFTDKGSIDWFGTVRGRIGYAYGPALLYVTGGLAYGEVKETVGYPGLPELVASLSRNNVDVGYAVGGGIEYKIGGAWSVKAEYQYIDLGAYRLSASASDAYGDTQTVKSNSISDAIHTVRVGLNYHVNDVYAPLK